jgi:DNA-binding LacI/PurR family transcriptional regulator
MAVTIKDIARRAGVSHSTVSRALRDDGAIAARTALRIKRLATRMGYVPSAAARSLKTASSRALGVVVTNIADPFLGEVVRGIEDASLEAGYSLFLAASHRDSAREKAILRALAERRAEGAIICSSQVSAVDLRELEQFGVPVVLVNNQVAGQFAHGIYHDDIWGGQEIVRHLLSLGHRRLAYLGNAPGGQANRDRQDGYCAALREAGIELNPEWILSARNGRPDAGAEATEAFLRLSPRPTAIFCYNDMIALGVLKRLKQAGLELPGDCSLAGFDDVFVAEYADPPLTTIAQPKYQLGRDAAELVLDLVRGDRPKRPRMRAIRGSLVVRSSTAPPKGGQ